jgi:hypothetical protein
MEPKQCMKNRIDLNGDQGRDLKGCACEEKAMGRREHNKLLKELAVVILESVRFIDSQNL